MEPPVHSRVAAARAGHEVDVGEGPHELHGVGRDLEDGVRLAGDLEDVEHLLEVGRQDSEHDLLAGGEANGDGTAALTVDAVREVAESVLDGVSAAQA